MDLEVGQVLALRIRFNNDGLVSVGKHPYLIIDVGEDIVEIAQLDSLKGKEFKAAKLSNKTIFCKNPAETVIDKDSYIQLDNQITLEKFDDLTNFRRQTDKLSSTKLENVLNAYRNYQEKHHLDENKIVYMDEAEIRRLNE